MADRRCRDCGRALEERDDLPTFLDELVRDALARTQTICLWCYDLNLLSGGFVPARLEERWDELELVQLYRAADDRKATKQLHWRQQKQERERKRMEKETAQAALV